MEGGDGEQRIVTEEESRFQNENLNGVEDGIQKLRRSVSLDSLSASKIIQDLANVLPVVESDRNSGTRRAGIEIESTRGNRSKQRCWKSKLDEIHANFFFPNRAKFIEQVTFLWWEIFRVKGMPEPKLRPTFMMVFIFFWVFSVR
ncbi:hypothetical protein OIU77_002358 [Salix suchowensis]|uniref:Uncharacterized protein n=1 Tax=Salix suchowensis TaxID=1278906 RepID=A0ABQ9B5U0_9ROSI|nr:hypothetical protein OIU77_002358 [Salix suchowensis]